MGKIQERKMKRARRFKSNDHLGSDHVLSMDFMTRNRLFEQKKEEKLQKKKQEYYGTFDRNKSIGDAEKATQRLYKHTRSKSRQELKEKYDLQYT